MSECHDSSPVVVPLHAFTLALVGNPNAGKTTLFNALTGLRAKTANFPGTTVERKVGRLHLDQKQIVVVDLPDASKISALSEPWFLTFEADVQLHPAMTAADLQRAGLDHVAKQWS